MLRKKHEFKPDRTDSGTLSKLYITKKQRLSLLKWFLFGLGLLVLSLVQDVIMSRFTVLGSTTDLVCGGIFLISLLIGVESCAVFALCASTVYYFAGFSPGVHCIILLTALSIFLNILRHSYLKKNFFSVTLCAVLGLMIYELLCFFFAIFVAQTSLHRIGIACMTCLLTGVALPVLYPIFVSIGKIGGETWKE
ncbi:MAG: hypothetical protein E7448_07255 [Ruminococcaceae bacterium]|nr:hypothetical protein [Oscillospiraceae bacterium]